MIAQIFRDRVDPFLDRGAEPNLSRPSCLSCPATPHGPRDSKGHAGDLARLERQTMIRASASGCRHRLDRVETIHALGLLGVAACGEIACVAEAAAPAAEEIGVERDDHVGLVEAVLRVDVLVECELRAGARAVGARRIPLMPFRRREAGEQIADLRGERR